MITVDKKPMNRKAILESEDSIIEFLGQFNKESLFLLSGAYVGSKLANYLLTLKPKNELIDEKVVEYWVECIKQNKFYYSGGHSTIHFDNEGKIMDWYERLCAIARCGITDRRLMPMVNFHFGIFPFLRPTMRAAEFPKPPVSIFTAPPVQLVEVEPIIPKYQPKYSGKAISLIMAIGVGDITISYSRRQSTAWEETNDSPLLAECISDGRRLDRPSDRFLTASEWAALRYTTALVDADDSSMFFSLIANKVSLGVTHPLSLLRDDFTYHSDKNSQFKMSLVINAWNAFRTERDYIQDWNGGEFPKAI